MSVNKHVSDMSLDEFVGLFEITKDDYGSRPWAARLEGRAFCLYVSDRLVDYPSGELPPIEDRAVCFKRKKDVIAALQATYKIAQKKHKRQREAAA